MTDNQTSSLTSYQTNSPTWGHWFRQVNASVLKGNSILAGANDKPLLVLSREGKGRVALLLTDQMWLWARGYDGGGPHVDLSRRLAHWLMKEPDLEEEALRASARGSEVTLERQSLKDETPPVTAIAPSGAREEIALAPAEPGLARANFTAKEMGLYHFESAGLSALVNVGPENPREFREVVSTTEKLRPLAEASGGSARRLASDDSGKIAMPRLVDMREADLYGGADWIGIKRAGASTLKGVEVQPLAIGIMGAAGAAGRGGVRVGVGGPAVGAVASVCYSVWSFRLFARGARVSQFAEHPFALGFVIIARRKERDRAALVPARDAIGVGEIGHRILHIGVGVEKTARRSRITHSPRGVVADLHQPPIGASSRSGIVTALALDRAMNQRLGHAIRPCEIGDARVERGGGRGARRALGVVRGDVRRAGGRASSERQGEKCGCRDDLLHCW